VNGRHALTPLEKNHPSTSYTGNFRKTAPRQAQGNPFPFKDGSQTPAKCHWVISFHQLGS
jgi:hypothetical protein